jgi:hypothetical protein
VETFASLATWMHVYVHSMCLLAYMIIIWFSVQCNATVLDTSREEEYLMRQNNTSNNNAQIMLQKTHTCDDSNNDVF